MSCPIGEVTARTCENRMKRKLDEESTLLQLFQLDQLDDDLPHLFSTTQPVCQNVTLKENWMISNIKVDIPEISTICWKHRENYGSKFRIRSCKCMYPGHVESKRKQTVKPMSLPAVLQTERLLSSAIVKIVLPFGASCCFNCMVRLYPTNLEEHSKFLGDACRVCYQEHHDATRYTQRKTPKVFRYT